MFLTKEDYKAVCDDYEFEAIQNNDDITEQAELTAIEQIKSYCRARYDMDLEFAKTGNERSAMLIQCTVNISLWLMAHRLPQNMGIERRDALYEESVRWLRDVQNSRAMPDFATYDTEDEQDTHNPVAFGSQKPTRCQW